MSLIIYRLNLKNNEYIDVYPVNIDANFLKNPVLNHRYLRVCCVFGKSEVITVDVNTGEVFHLKATTVPGNEDIMDLKYDVFGDYAPVARHLQTARRYWRYSVPYDEYSGARDSPE